MIQAVSDDLPPHEVERVARDCGWTVAARSARMVLTRCFGMDSIKDCLVSPFVGGCEVDEDGWTVPGHRLLAHLRAGGMGMAITTGSAYQYDLALTFTTALAQRHPELAHKAEMIDRSVHELMSNALVHGNLDVTSPRPGMEGFDAYCKSLDAALADPGRLGRRVEISSLLMDGFIEIAVLDHGAGYDIHNVTRIEVGSSPRQHGLAIVAADPASRLRVEDDGRCAILRIALGAS